MNVNIQSLKFDADVKLLDFIRRKLNKLDTFYDRIIDGEVILKLNNEGVNNKTVEVKVNVPGEQLFAAADARTFEAATEEVVKTLKRQIRQYKERLVAH